MPTNTPKTYKAQMIPAFGQPFQLSELPVPELSMNEILIKVKATAINGYDEGFITGRHGQTHGQNVFPQTAGFEASGVIEAIGANVNKYNIGQRVCFIAYSRHRAYAEYAITLQDYVIPIDDDVSFEEAASEIINPLTVIGLFDLVGSSEAIVQNAAASQLGRQLQQYFTKRAVNVINIVRREEQVHILKSEGAQYVLNENSPFFDQQLRQLSIQLNANIFLDSVAGESTGTILAQLPVGTTTYVFGNLSDREISNINVLDLLREKKVVKGFTLFDWFAKYPGIIQDNIFQKEFNRHIKHELKLVQAQSYPLQRINEAYESYKKNPTKQGKILIIQD